MNTAKRIFKLKPTHLDKELIQARKKGLIPEIPYPKWMVNNDGNEE